MKIAKILFGALFFFASTAHAGVPIKLEKDVLVSDVTNYEQLVEFALYATKTAVTPIASQTYGYGDYSMDYIHLTITNLPNVEVYRIKANFTATEGLSNRNSVWLELKLDGIVKGEREKVNLQPLPRSGQVVAGCGVQYPTKVIDCWGGAAGNGVCPSGSTGKTIGEFSLSDGDKIPLFLCVVN